MGDAALSDRLFQFAYVCAHLGRCVWWRLTGRASNGSLVAIWSNNQLLLIKESYRKQWSLPGGGIGLREDSITAAIREAKEEVGISLANDALSYVGRFEENLHGVAHYVYIFEATFVERPAVSIDNREIIRAGWYDRDTALELELTPLLGRYLRKFGAKSPAKLGRFEGHSGEPDHCPSGTGPQILE